MPRLRDRNRQIPTGLTFFQPETKWKAAPWSSFETIVSSLMHHRRANPYLAQQHHWKLAKPDVENEVDEYNAAICQAHGWTNYILDTGGSPPKPRSPLQDAGRLVAGIGVMHEMFGKEGPTDKATAQRRAQVCAGCQMNETGTSWTEFFTTPASAMIRKAIGALKDLELKTDFDGQLNICSVCLCPLKTKVWARINHIKDRLLPEDKAKLPPHCWVLTELEEKKDAA